MATNKASVRNRLGSSSTRVVKKPTTYGNLIGNDSDLLPMSEALTSKLYGDRLTEDMSLEVKAQVKEIRNTYARSHSTDPVKIKTPASFGRTKVAVRKPPTAKGKEVDEGESEAIGATNANKASDTPVQKRPVRRDSSSDKGKEEDISEKKVLAKPSNQSSYPLVNAATKGKAIKIQVERVQPRFPGEDVPESSLRTEIGEIPTLDIKMKPAEGDLTPEIVENPKLIEPFAIQQKNFAILEDPNFLSRFKLTKESAIGGYNINELKQIARKLGLQVQFNRAQLVTAIDTEINAVGVEMEEEED
jgi:hypothetical protein